MSERLNKRGFSIISGDGKLYSLAIFIIMSAVFGLFILASNESSPTGFAGGGGEGSGNQQSCVDTDGGSANYNSKGIIYLNGNYLAEDFCSGNKVREYFCVSQFSASSTEYSCSGTCSNGACVSSPTSPQTQQQTQNQTQQTQEQQQQTQQQTSAETESNSAQTTQNSTKTCTESDGGKNYFSSSSIVVNGQVTGNDYCIGNKSIQEYSCDAEKNAITEPPYQCPEICQSGACTAVQKKKEDTLLLINEKIISEPLKQEIQKNIQESQQKSSSASGSSSSQSQIDSQVDSNKIAEATICGEYSRISPVSASSSSSREGFPASNAIDGKLETSWYGKSESNYPKTITFNLGGKKCLRAFDIHFYDWDIPINADLQVSDDGNSWVTVISGRTFSSRANINVNMPEVVIAEYARIVENSGKRNYGNIDEISFDAAPFSAAQ